MVIYLYGCHRLFCLSITTCFQLTDPTRVQLRPSWVQVWMSSFTNSWNRARRLDSEPSSTCPQTLSLYSHYQHHAYPCPSIFNYRAKAFVILSPISLPSASTPSHHVIIVNGFTNIVMYRYEYAHRIHSQPTGTRQLKGRGAVGQWWNRPEYVLLLTFASQMVNMSPRQIPCMYNGPLPCSMLRP